MGMWKAASATLEWWWEPVMMGKAVCLDHLQVSALGTRGRRAAGNRRCFQLREELQSRCSTAGSPITLLLCSLFQRLTVFRDNSRSRLNEATLSRQSCKIVVIRKGDFKGVKYCRSPPREMKSCLQQWRKIACALEMGISRSVCV